MKNVLISLLLYGFGLVGLGLLNGQVFSNRIVAIVLSLLSGLLISPNLAKSRPRNHRVAAGILLSLFVITIVAIIPGLPKAREFQNGFNARVRAFAEESRQRAQQTNSQVSSESAPDGASPEEP